MDSLEKVKRGCGLMFESYEKYLEAKGEAVARINKLTHDLLEVVGSIKFPDSIYKSKVCYIKGGNVVVSGYMDRLYLGDNEDVMIKLDNGCDVSLDRVLLCGGGFNIWEQIKEALEEPLKPCIDELKNKSLM